MFRYSLEFILNSPEVNPQKIKDSIMEFGENLSVAELFPEAGKDLKDYKININTEDPTIIFDICSQFGRIKSVKIDEDQAYGTK